MAWKVTSYCLEHSCNKRNNRSRNYRHSLLIVAAERNGGHFQEDFTPKQIQAEVLARTALNMKLGSAKRSSSEWNDTDIWGQLWQFAELPELLFRLRAQDPDGTYILETERTEWGSNCFRRMFISFGFVQNYQKVPGKIRFATLDACHMFCFFHGTMWLFVERDADHKLTVLAFGLSGSENASNAAWFIRIFRQHFPTIETLLTDQGTAFTSRDAQEAARGICQEMIDQAVKNGDKIVPDVLFAMCMHHYVPHLFKRIHVKDKKTLKYMKGLVQRFAYETSTIAAEKLLEEARGLNPELGKELETIKHRFSCAYRVEIGRSTGRTVASSNAESANHMVEDVRTKGPSQMISTMNEITEHHEAERRENALKWQESGKQLVKWATDYLWDQLAASAGMGTTMLTTLTMDTIAGIVQTKSMKTNRSVTLTRNTLTGKCVCDCRTWDDTGLLCAHAIALIKQVSAKRPSLRWDYMDKRFADASNYTENYLQRYAEKTYPVAFVTTGDSKELTRKQLIQSTANGTRASTLQCMPGVVMIKSKKYKTTENPLKRGKKRHKSAFEKSKKPTREDDVEFEDQAQNQRNGDANSSQEDPEGDADENVDDDLDEDEANGDDRYHEDDNIDGDNKDNNKQDPGGEEHDESGPVDKEELTRRFGRDVESKEVESFNTGRKLTQVRKKHSKKHCSKCGSTEHNISTCNSPNLTELLSRFGVLPGQYEKTQQGAREV